MMRKLLLSLAACMPVITAFSQEGLWSTVPKSTAQTYLNGRSAASSLPSGYELVKLNRSLLQQLQQKAPLVKTGERSSLSPVQISLPLPVAGKFQSGAFTESPVLSDELAKQLPNFKTYEIKDTVTKRLQGRLSVTPQGVTGLIFTNKGAMYIHPVNTNYPDVHMAYYVKDIPVTQPLACGVKEILEGTATGARMQGTLAGDCQLRNYRLAVAATGEYTTWAGGQTLAALYIATLINDVRTIYERELGITFTLITNNSLLYTNAATDPYATVSFATGALLTTNHNTITTALGTGSFDIGFLLNNGWNGGLAAGSSACVPAWKGMAGAGITFGTGINPTPGPQGPLLVSTVAHEIAHQFSAMHTMAATNGFCGGSNSVPASAYEPGGGSTIMAYAGTCTGNSYQFYNDMYFHNGSIMQIMNYAVNSATCAVTTPMSNTAPSVSVPAASYTIPASTPFILTATGTDATNNTIYYSWEQMDAGVTGTWAPSDLNTAGPNFRSYPSTTNNTRYFPQLADVVAGVSPPYEVLPSVSRPMNFMVMVHDYAIGGGCTAQQSVAVNTDDSGGPFSVTSQTTATNWVANGSNTATITWNVGVTNAAPINVSNVDIIFSSDGGTTFNDTLAANTANDGTETIVIPSLATGVGRIMVKSRNNIFYNVNAANISITSMCAANGTTFTPNVAVTGSVGNSALNLSLSPLYGSPISISGTLTVSDPTGEVTVQNITYNRCENFGSGNQYDAYRFTPTVSGNYTFTRTTGDPYCVLTLYSDNYDPNNGCSNYITSNGLFDEDVFTIDFPDNFTVALSAGQYYTLAVSTFFEDAPTLPAPYSVSVTGAGMLYSNPPNPAGFNYTFVIVDNVTGLIKAFDASADLSNGTSYPYGGRYTIYGLSYSNAIAATLSSYTGTSFASFRNALLFNPATLCGNFSANNVQVTVTGILSADPTRPGSNIQANNTNKTLAVYPNPVQSSLTLAYNSTRKETVSVRVLNTLGSLVYQGGFTAQKGNNLYTIPAGALAKGIYVVQLVTDSGNMVSRFMKD
jgi:hypothetical protein